MDAQLDLQMAKLIPVSQWIFYLWKVEYAHEEEGPTIRTRYLVETDTHIATTAWDDVSGPAGSWAQWSIVCQVERPRQVGTLYGMRLDESGRAAGEREARARGLM